MTWTPPKPPPKASYYQLSLRGPSPHDRWQSESVGPLALLLRAAGEALEKGQRVKIERYTRETVFQAGPPEEEP